MKAVAIITARGGSKRMPGKNIRSFLGKPIIVYTIEAALKSGIFEEVMVSTDDVEIAEVAKAAGASLPFLRSAKNSDDFSTTADVLSEVLDEYAAIGKLFDFACCCYPTAPFITAGKLQDAYKLLKEKNADVVMPVAKYSVPIWWALKKIEDKVSPNWPEKTIIRSQDLETSFYDSGQFYFLNTASFSKSKSLFTDNTLGIEVSEIEVQDIDNEVDWKLAEMKYSLLQK